MREHLYTILLQSQKKEKTINIDVKNWLHVLVGDCLVYVLLFLHILKWNIMPIFLVHVEVAKIHRNMKLLDNKH